MESTCERLREQLKEHTKRARKEVFLPDAVIPRFGPSSHLDCGLKSKGGGAFSGFWSTAFCIGNAPGIGC